MAPSIRIGEENYLTFIMRHKLDLFVRITELMSEHSKQKENHHE